jgi:nicotinamide-nucleotide amidase
MWFDVDGIVYVSMPGVPYEMMGMMSKQVLPLLKDRFKTPVIRHRTFRTQGVGESLLASWIESWEDALPAHMKLAYLPAAGQVRLRISATGEQAEKLDEEIEQQAVLLYELIGKHIFAESDVELEQVIHQWMIDHNKTLSTAESCTGGTIASMLTKLPGASKYFEGSTVCYSYEIKERLLGVKTETLNTYGAVSEETVKEMVEGALKLHQTDYTVAVSGIAGPDGGTEEKPVGTVWIAIGGPEGTKTKKFRFSTNRERNITMASLSALNMLRRYLLKQED